MILVFDVGTSSLKALLFDRGSRIVAEAEAPYPTATLPGGRHEQDPHDWLTALRQACAKLAGRLDEVALIVLAGTMQSVIPVDATGRPVRPAILYSDSRAEAEFAVFARDVAAAGGAALIGNPPDKFMAACKIAWLRDNEPASFAATATFHSGSKDFVIQWLTGIAATDATAATTVGLMDLADRHWHPGLVAALGLAPKQLPAIRTADAEVGALLPAAAAALGLRSGIPVLNGCGDAGASTLGAGIAAPGETYAYVGTTAWAAQVAPAATTTSDSIYTLAHPTRDDATIRIGAMLCGGDSAAWYSELCGRSIADLDLLLDEPGFAPGEAIFLPYLKGERCPFMDPQVRGGFLLLDRSDTAARLHFAVLESIALALAANIEAMGPVTGDLALIGGGAVSRHLPPLIAAATGLRVAVADMPAAATAFGAFAIGAARLGWTVARPGSGAVIAPLAGGEARRARRRSLFAAATASARQLATLA